MLPPPQLLPRPFASDPDLRLRPGIEMLLAIEREPPAQMIDRAFAADRQTPKGCWHILEVPAYPKVVGGLGATQFAIIVCGHMSSYIESDGVRATVCDPARAVTVKQRTALCAVFTVPFLPCGRRFGSAPGFSNSTPNNPSSIKVNSLPAGCRSAARALRRWYATSCPRSTLASSNIKSRNCRSEILGFKLLSHSLWIRRETRASQCAARSSRPSLGVRTKDLHHALGTL